MVPSLLAAVGFWVMSYSGAQFACGSGYKLEWACGSGVVNYSGPAAVGYELQWACGSRVTSYSGPVTVGLRVTVGL